MAARRTTEDLARFVTKENGGVMADRGSAYPCTQQQIDDYTLKPNCYHGTLHSKTEREAFHLLGNFLNPTLSPAFHVIRALSRLADAVYDVHDWHPDLIIKAMSDIDTAFFNGALKGNVKVRWVEQALLDERMMLPPSRAITMGNTRYLFPAHPDGCSSIWLSLQGVFEGARNPRKRMWQALFHELIHAYILATCHHYRPPGAYDRARGWSDGHGILFRLCLRALEVRTLWYLGFAIASSEDIADFNTID